jgi:hypothetical protein
VDTQAITSAAAFLSGIGSVLTGALALWWERRRGKEDCAARLNALHEGMVLRDMVDKGEPLTEEER